MFAHPQRIIESGLGVYYRTSNKPFARLGLAIAKKHIKKATARNRIKRLVRESFRHHQDKLKNVDIIVLTRNDISTQTNKQLLEKLSVIWQRMSEQCESS